MRIARNHFGANGWNGQSVPKHATLGSEFAIVPVQMAISENRNALWKNPSKRKNVKSISVVESGWIGAAGEDAPQLVTAVFEVARGCVKIRINLAILGARKKPQLKWKSVQIDLAATGKTGQSGLAAARHVAMAFRRELGAAMQLKISKKIASGIVLTANHALFQRKIVWPTLKKSVGCLNECSPLDQQK